MRLLGISAFYHDRAAALVQTGKLWPRRRKSDSHGGSTMLISHHAIRYCLETAKVDLDGVDHVVFYEKPLIKFERLMETYLANAPRGFQSFRMAIPLWIKEKLLQKLNLEKALRVFSPSGKIDGKLLFAEHHQSHAASAFFPSPFEEAVVLTMDGVGEWTTTSIGIGRGHTLEPLREIHWPHSIGMLYSAFTYYTGFKVNSGEYKLMGLAPYGEPRYAELILDNVIDVKDDGSFWLDQSYFNYATGLTMTSQKFHDLFGGPPRDPEAPLTQRDMDLAASVQKVTEEVVLRITRSLAKAHGIDNLCLAGGVALNCVANGKVLRDGTFKRIWIQPAAGDAGGSVGAALAAYHQHFGMPRKLNGAMDAMRGSYLGPEFSQAEIERRLAGSGAKFTVLGEPELLERTCDALQAGHAVGWFQGRMEFGPRALGARSILGDPRNPEMQRNLNLKIKYRESFRPFAPSVLREDVAEYFELDGDSPYMLLVADVKRNRRRPMTPSKRRLLASTSSTWSARTSPRSRMSTIQPESRPCIRRPIPATTRFFALSSDGRAAQSWSTRASTFAGNLSSAPPRTHFSASWAPRWKLWYLAIAC